MYATYLCCAWLGDAYLGDIVDCGHRCCHLTLDEHALSILPFVGIVLLCFQPTVVVDVLKGL